jgi:hypothetical protein
MPNGVTTMSAITKNFAIVAKPVESLVAAASVDMGADRTEITSAP